MESHVLCTSSPAMLFSRLSPLALSYLGLALSPFRMGTAELSSWSVVLGSLKQEGLSPGAEEVGVAALQLPKAYNHYSQGSDLALLQLTHPIVHTTLCLPQPTHHFPFGASCWATGWDQNTSDGKYCPRHKSRVTNRISSNCASPLLPLCQS